MRVLMLTSETSLMDGINRHILAISIGLIAEGFEVAVCSTHRRGALTDELERAGVKTYSLNCLNGHSISALFRFMCVMRSFKPNVVHVHILSLTVRMVLSVFYRRMKIVGTVHGILDPCAHKTLRMRVEEVICRLFPIPFRRRVYISNGVRRALGCGMGDLTIYNPIGMRTMMPRNRLRSELGLDRSAKIVGTACRIAEVKNPRAFTRVMCEVTARIVGVHAIIIGDGDSKLMAGLRRIAVASPNVHFLGYRADARQLLSECDCFVMTSAREGMPTALLEAMAAGVPVAFWCGEGGLEDLEELNEKDGPIGVVAAQGDEAGLVDGICKILTEGLQVKGKEVAARHFSLAEVTKQLVECYLA